MKTFLQTFLLIFLIVSAKAQAIEIKGHVKDAESNAPLIGAYIYLKEEKQTVVSDNEGEFEFKHLANKSAYTIIVEYAGYDTLIKVVSTTEGKEKADGLKIEIKCLLHSSPVTLTEINVRRKRDNETDESSRYKEKNGDQIINIVGSKAIELSPDVTVANVLQRLPGVSLERSNQGDGRYAIIRGMDQRYNNTLLNGEKIPSPDAYNRFIPLDIIPSDLVQKIEVYKSITPDMEADAIGGTVNIVMKDAPDKLLVAADISTGYSNILWKQPYSYFDKTAINKLDPAARNGYVSNGVPYNASPEDFTRKNLVFSPKYFTPYYSGNLSFGRRFLQNKLGVIVSGSYQNRYIGSTNEYYESILDAHGQSIPTQAYARQYSDQQIRRAVNAKIDYQLNAKNKITFTNIFLNMEDVQSRHSTDTSLTTFRTGPGTGQVFTLDRSEDYTQTIEAAILQGEHQISRKFSLTWTGLYSVATGKMPDQAETNVDFLIDSAHHSSATYFDNIRRVWQHNRDMDYSGRLDLTYKSKVFGQLFSFKAGGLYRAKSRDNYQNEYMLRPPQTGPKPQWVGIETQEYIVYNTGGTAEYGTNNYTAYENITAMYGMLKTDIGALQVIAGVRYENTDQHYYTNAPMTIDGRSAFITYSDVLPNLQLKYALNEKQNLRFAAYEAIARPNYFDLVPYHIQGDQFQMEGNPHMGHTTASNLDLRYEFFPNAKEELLAGVFYKNIKNPIETTYDLTNIYNYVVTYSSVGTATNYGFELAVIKYFGHFGFNANYTFTQSTISSPKVYNDFTSGSTYTKDENRPMQGQARDIFNLSGLYNNDKLGLDMQIAYQYTGKRIVNLSPYYGQDHYQQGMSRLDCSANKSLGKHFHLFVKVNNILNSPYIVKTTDGLLVEKNFYGVNYIMGLNYKL